MRVDSMIVRLPKIAPTVYPRAKIQSWLEYHADVPLRYISAPPGSGKTTIAVMYARTRATAVGYIRVQPQTTALDLCAGMGAAVGLAGVGDYEELLRRLSTLPRVEIVVDDVDSACVAVREALQRIYHDVADSVTFIYLARSPEALSVGSGEAQGIVAFCDPGWLNFRTDEVALYAQALGLNEDPLSIARLHRATHGWATAIAGVCRAAAGSSERLCESWPRWRHLARGPLAELVADALGKAPGDVADSFRQLISGQTSADQRSLRLFARYGLFVHQQDGQLTFNPLVGLTGEAEPGAVDGRPVSQAFMEMFGRFEFRINGNPVVWQRRRDRQIVQYLAMQPEGGATRAQLIAAFWPDADRQLAAQSLRTACSTIRRAFAVCVGPANVGRFFVADQLVELKLEAVESSVACFTSHIALADRAHDAGDARNAYIHYTAAERLYVSPFLSGEPPAEWSEPYAARLAAMDVRASGRLDVLAQRVNSDDVRGFSSILKGHVRSA